MYVDSTAMPNIATVRRALVATGETFPKPVVKALAEHDKIKDAARAFTPASQSEVADAVAACLLADRDPLEDDTVRRLVTSHALSDNGAPGYGINLTAQAQGRVVAALTAEVDTILALLAPHAEKAGADLTDARDLIGDTDDPQTILARGVEAVEAWARATKARDLLNTIDSAWSALAALTGFASSIHPALRLTDDVGAVESAGRQADAWALVRAGARITLADRNTYRERATALAEAVGNRASAAQRDEDAAVARRFSFRG